MLQVTSVTKYFGGDAVLEGASLELRPGERLALVGPNGAGKSTLLRIILGEVEPDSGQVRLAPGRSIAYLPQDAGVTPGRALYDEMLALFADVVALEAEQRRVEEEMARVDPNSPRVMSLAEEHAELHAEFDRRGGYTLEAEIGRVLHGLGFSQDDYRKRVEHFSGGWQMRIALARLLLQRPDMLLLDEPTNHLDLRATEWLEGYLRQYKGAVIVVSHDRYFLDVVATRTVELEGGRLVEYPGNYSFYVREKDRRRTALEAAFQRQQNYLNRQQAWIDRFHADKRRSSQTKSREKLLDKMERVDAPGRSGRAIGFRFPSSTPSGRKVFDLQNAGQAYGGKWVFQGLDLLIERGDRVALVGPNGAGKSTLLRVLAAVEKPAEGAVVVGANVLRAYYAQDQSETLNDDNTVLDEIYSIAPRDWSVQDVRTMLGRFLFSGDDVYKPIGVLSGGERSRLALARMLLRASNVLLLDEPTNHLDVSARETLEAALADYPGTLVLASHDRYLMDKLANKVVEMDGERRRCTLATTPATASRRPLEAAEARGVDAERLEDPQETDAGLGAVSRRPAGTETRRGKAPASGAHVPGGHSSGGSVRRSRPSRRRSSPPRSGRGAGQADGGGGLLLRSRAILRPGVRVLGPLGQPFGAEQPLGGAGLAAPGDGIVGGAALGGRSAQCRASCCSVVRSLPCYARSTRSATASPISDVPTWVAPSSQMSRVRMPSAIADSTARSTASAASGMSQRMPEHHRRAQDGRQGVDAVLAGMPGGGAVDRLIYPQFALAEAGRWEHPHGAGHLGCLVGQDVAEGVLRHHHVEVAGRLDQPHGAGVHQHVLQGDAGIVRGDPLRDPSPQPRALQDVRLVHGGDLLAPACGPARRPPGSPARSRPPSRPWCPPPRPRPRICRVSLGLPK